MAEHGTESVTAVAIAYDMAKAPYVFPVVGGRKVEHLRDNIRALDMRLTPAQVEFLESARPFDIGYALDVVGPDAREGKGQSIGMTSSTAFDAVPFPRPVGY